MPADELQCAMRNILVQASCLGNAWYRHKHTKQLVHDLRSKMLFEIT